MMVILQKKFHRLAAVRAVVIQLILYKAINCKLSIAT